MSAYDAAGKRNSSKTHARQGHLCDFCDRVAFGNGGNVAHSRAHVRSGEAVELLKWYSHTPSPLRVFLPAEDADRIAKWVADGYTLSTD